MNSQSLYENQIDYASHLAHETHFQIASQISYETHRNIASQSSIETHRKYASQLNYENHYKVAIQKIINFFLDILKSNRSQGQKWDLPKNRKHKRKKRK